MEVRNHGYTPDVAALRPLFQLHAELCKALAHEHRLAILYALGTNEVCVSDLARTLDIPLHTVSQHLRILKERTLVQARKDGQTVYYSITNPRFIEGCTLIRRALIEQHQATGSSLDAARLLDIIDQDGDRRSRAGT
jgi:DNA-binding transcriptional ArsR family regulator